MARSDAMPSSFAALTADPERRRVLRRLALIAAGLPHATLQAAAEPAAARPAAPSGRVITADPTDYLAKLRRLRAGDTLRLAPGAYGVDAEGRDTAAPPGLPIFGLHGEPGAPITITGPDDGPRPVLLGRGTHNTIRVANASHVVVRRLEVDGRSRGGFGVAAQGPAHAITIEDNHFHGQDAHQQVVAISTTGHATWHWVIRRNEIVGAGTGLYLGNSDGSSPFIGGLIEHNLVRDTLGYNLQIKHQVWPRGDAGLPPGPATTIIRHNVFSKSGNSATGPLARPNVLLGAQPAHGPGADHAIAVYGNLFVNNPSHAMFQGEGRFALYANLFVTERSAIRVQDHNGRVRDVRIVGNTVLARGHGLMVSGGGAEGTQVVCGNAIFAGGAPLAMASLRGHAYDNVVDLDTAAHAYLKAVDPAQGEFDLTPRGDALRDRPLDASPLAGYVDADLDFNGLARDWRWRGAYSGNGANPGWALALARKR